ncbi:MAG: hypothetical protein R3C10_23615 [Pirellulales bacterium]
MGHRHHLPTLAGWVYLAAIVDLFSRKVVGWAMSDSLATPLVSTLRRAIEGRVELPRRVVAPQRPWLPVHERLPEDEGNSSARVFDAATLLRQRRGQAFFWSLKHSGRSTKHTPTNSARLSVFKYDDVFYNVATPPVARLQNPEQFEAENAPALAA